MAETVENKVDIPAKSEEKSSEVVADVTPDGKNEKQIKCHSCPSIILVPGTAILVSHKFQLPDPQLKEKKTKENLNQYWCVDNMYAFENVGFSNTVDGVKYLVCADCEIGPIGFHDLDTKLSYISVNKISYC